MKKIQKPSTEVWYICEVCERESLLDEEITECEKLHKQDDCVHPNLKYFFRNGYKSDGFSVVMQCKDCDKEQGVPFSDEPSGQLMAKNVFNFLRDKFISEYSEDMVGWTENR